MPIRTLLLLVSGAALGCAQVVPNPTLQQYLTTRQASIAQVYGSIAGKPIGQPVFGAQLLALFEVYCGQPSATLGCNVFNIQQAENQVDMLVSMGATVLEVNISPWIYADDSGPSATARAYIDAVLTYLKNTYPTVNLTLNPPFLAENLAQAVDNNGKWSCGTMTGGTGAGNTISAPYDGSANDITTCMTTGRSWLGGKGVYAYLASKYTPYRFTVMHEMTSNNVNYNWTSCVSPCTGSAVRWKTFVGSMMTIVNTNSSISKLGIAMDRFESAYQATLLGATGCGGSCSVQYVGQDVYTDDIWNTSNGLGAQASMISTAQSGGYETIFSEMWSTAWAPSTGISTDTSAYEGAGNCDWRLYDRDRQDVTALAIWAAANGITEVQFFSAADAATVCIYQAPGSGKDSTNSAFYASAAATASAPSINPTMTQRTPTFYFLQSLIRWFPTFPAGVPLPI